MSEEPITCKHFFQGAVKPKTGIKALAFVPWMLLFFGIGYCVWFTLRPKPTQTIIAQKGSEVKVTQINKTSRFFIPFIEVGVEQRNNADMGTYIRGGVRVEF